MNQILQNLKKYILLMFQGFTKNYEKIKNNGNVAYNDSLYYKKRFKK